jgi:membrane protein required for colicin V production
MTELTPHTLNWTDYIIIAIITISTLISLMRGFTSEAVSLLTWIIAVIIAFKFSGMVSGFLSNMIKTPSVRLIISFVLLFICILIFGAILNYFFTVFVNKTGLSSTNRLLGMVFGFARGVLLVAIFILFARFTSVIKDPWWSSAQLIPYFQGISDWLQRFVPNKLIGVSHYIANTPTTGTE